MPQEISRNAAFSLALGYSTLQHAQAQLDAATTPEAVHRIALNYVRANGPRHPETPEQITQLVDVIFRLKNSRAALNPRKGAIMAKGFATAQKQIADEMGKGSRVGSAGTTPSDSDSESVRTVTTRSLNRTRSVLDFFSPSNSRPQSPDNTPEISDGASVTSKVSRLSRARSVLNRLTPTSSALASPIYKRFTPSSSALSSPVAKTFTRDERASFETARQSSETVRQSSETIRPALPRSQSVIGFFSRPTNGLVRRSSLGNLLSGKRSATWSQD